MPETVQVKPADLLIDEVNPRLAEPNIGQRVTCPPKTVPV